MLLLSCILIFRFHFFPEMSWPVPRQTTQFFSGIYPWANQLPALQCTQTRYDRHMAKGGWVLFITLKRICHQLFHSILSRSLFVHLLHFCACFLLVRHQKACRLLLVTGFLDVISASRGRLSCHLCHTIVFLFALSL